MNPTPQRPLVAVYCAASENVSPHYYTTAYEVGRLLVESGLDVVCGGGREGLMKSVIEGSLEAGGDPVGVLPKFMMDFDWAHKSLRRCEVVEGMHPRKARMMDLAKGVITLPGGYGTLEEISEVLSWKKLAIWTGPVVILNERGFYDGLLEQLRRFEAEHFAELKPGAPLFEVARDAREAVDIVSRSLSV